MMPTGPTLRCACWAGSQLSTYSLHGIFPNDFHRQLPTARATTTGCGGVGTLWYLSDLSHHRLVKDPAQALVLLRHQTIL